VVRLELLTLRTVSGSTSTGSVSNPSPTSSKVRVGNRFEVAEPLVLLVEEFAEVETRRDGLSSSGILDEVVLLDAALEEQLELLHVALELRLRVDPGPLRRGVSPLLAEADVEDDGPVDVARRFGVGEQDALVFPGRPEPRRPGGSRPVRRGAVRLSGFR